MRGLVDARTAAIAVIAIAISAGCARTPTRHTRRSIYASAEEVEENFRGKRFILGDNNSIAMVRPLDSSPHDWLKLPFWLGINVLVPGVTEPREGGYYVISEATLGKPLAKPGEWMIEAGSALVQQQAVFVTTRTHYVGKGKILPTIVQYMSKREFRRGDGKKFEIPIIREVSLPMKWTLGGDVPNTYAHYSIE